jgi:hypothetical protein
MVLTCILEHFTGSRIMLMRVCLHIIMPGQRERGLSTYENMLGQRFKPTYRGTLLLVGAHLVGILWVSCGILDAES